MRELLHRDVLTPLATILVIQTTITMSSYAIPVIAKEVSTGLAITPTFLGAMVSVVYATAMVVGLMSGGLIGTFGAARAFQIMLVLTSAGTILFSLGHPLWLLAGAVLIGAATGPMNPAGSHVLARVSPPNWQPFVFSLKQCGTPAGGALAGAVLPPLILLYDWQTALYVVPAIAVAGIVMAGFFGVGPREPRAATARFSLGAALGSLRLVVSDRGLRRYAVCGMAFAGVQVAMITYIVIYLQTEIHLPLDVAGLIFSVQHASGIAARIVLGAIAGRWLSSRNLLVLLGLIMACGGVGLAFSEASWPVPVIFALATVTGIGGNGWVGLFFSEIARGAPDGRTADAASGAQFLVYTGICAGPLLAGELIERAGYGAAFVAFAVTAALASLALLRHRSDR